MSLLATYTDYLAASYPRLPMGKCSKCVNVRLRPFHGRVFYGRAVTFKCVMTMRRPFGGILRVFVRAVDVVKSG